MSAPRVLAVRLGAMGDVIQTLPAVESLATMEPKPEIDWLVESKWAPLVEGNPVIRRVLTFDRSSANTVFASVRRLRQRDYDIVVDFQGRIRSAAVTWAARSERRWGFHESLLKERPAAWMYHERVNTTSGHVVDRYVDLAIAAGGRRRVENYAIPQGQGEGTLPDGPFVLASPLAGWGAKQWPSERWRELAGLLGREGLALVVNGALSAEPMLRAIEGTAVHVSGLAGLIDATRRATAVVGLDSGPMHLAAALGVPLVALFGPTDPARNGPRGSHVRVIRQPGAATSYKHVDTESASMCAIGAQEVFDCLLTLTGSEARRKQ